MSAVTPWFAPTVRPVHVGMYHAQDTHMNCDCCWFELHWNGREWHSDRCTPRRYATLFFNGHLRRWRGSTQPAAKGAEG
jgi:hypothetical protein